MSSMIKLEYYFTKRLLLPGSETGLSSTAPVYSFLFYFFSFILLFFSFPLLLLPRIHTGLSLRATVSKVFLLFFIFSYMERHGVVVEENCLDFSFFCFLLRVPRSEIELSLRATVSSLTHGRRARSARELAI